MLKVDKFSFIRDLPLDIYDALVVELSRENAWKIVADYFCKKLHYPKVWIQNLGKNTHMVEEVCINLLKELDIKMCNIEILCKILSECKLYNALSILHEPEPFQIIEHPDNEIETDVKYVECGEVLKLSCLVRGLPEPTYQWLHDSKKIDNQTSRELVIVINDLTQVGLYQCQITQTDCKLKIIKESLTRSVYVDFTSTEIKIKRHPIHCLEIKKDDCLKLICEAIGYPDPHYQWYRDNVQLVNQIRNILEIENFSAKDEGKYYCHIYNGVSEKFTDKCSVIMDLPRQQAVAKVALLIANENYYFHEKLYTPKNDVTRIAQILKNQNFYVICLADLTYSQMINAMRIFCHYLMEGVYGFFYFAGHGFKMQENYMLSVDAPRNYLRKEAICESELLSMALKSDPTLFVTVLDMCQTLPPQESNPSIHNEVPSIKEYKGTKNLRNLLQAYSTSSYGPSYERMGNNNGMYALHLCKYLGDNIPLTRVFELVGKSIDTALKGLERNQIPMFATTITKPFRFTDSLEQKDDILDKFLRLEKLLEFSEKIVDINFKKVGLTYRAVISQHSKPFLNYVEISIPDNDKFEINFYKSVPSKRNNLYKSSNKNNCWLHSPQLQDGPLVISLLDNGVHIGAALIEVTKYVPKFLQNLGQNVG